MARGLPGLRYRRQIGRGQAEELGIEPGGYTLSTLCLALFLQGRSNGEVADLVNSVFDDAKRSICRISNFRLYLFRKGRLPEEFSRSVCKERRKLSKKKRRRRKRWNYSSWQPRPEDLWVPPEVVFDPEPENASHVLVEFEGEVVVDER